MRDNYDAIYFLGDIHGQHYPLSRFLKPEIKNSLIIQVGDFGVGFQSISHDALASRKITKWLTSGNNHLVLIRGNHDDPSLFTNNSFLNSEAITLIPDYTYKTINNKSFLFVGGAISIDRLYRQPGKDYWPDENFILCSDLSSITKCDVLVIHTSPDVLYPYGDLKHLSSFLTKDISLEAELISERKLVTQLYDCVKPQFVINGHFHKSHYENVNGCIHKTLDINEFWELRI